MGATANKMHVIGFAYWGDTFDIFTVRYEDGREEQCKVPFVDWAHKAPDDYRDIVWLGSNIETVRYMITSGRGDHLACLHHSVVELGGGQIESIVLPENFFLHVMAITTEESN
ncbi:MAG: hypothetical protein K2M95_05575 [Clostridiales bacterium]|nr:hypothetical protein [Clostridiales bacterium]